MPTNAQNQRSRPRQRPLLTALSVSLFASASAAAQTTPPPQPAPIQFDLASIDADPHRAPTLTALQPKCRNSQHSDEIVVCAQDNRQYRLDPETLRSTRDAEAAPAQPNALASAMRHRCEPTSERGCPGTNVVPITAIAVTVIKAVILTADGNDWREALPPSRPDAYQIYQETRSRRSP